MQTVTIQVAPQVAQLLLALQRRADTEGVTLDSLLLPLVPENGAQPSERPFYETATPEEWVREFTKWADSHDPNTPALPIEAVSRESMYSDDNSN
jgi:hypothetical protein